MEHISSIVSSLYSLYLHARCEAVLLQWSRRFREDIIIMKAKIWVHPKINSSKNGAAVCRSTDPCFNLLHLLSHHSLVEVVIVLQTNQLNSVQLSTLVKVIQSTVTLQSITLLLCMCQIKLFMLHIWGYSCPRSHFYWSILCPRSLEIDKATYLTAKICFFPPIFWP